MMGVHVSEMIERSSFGTPEAQALRGTVSDEKAAALVAEAFRRSDMARCMMGSAPNRPRE